MLTYFFVGYKIISIPMSRAADFLELCRRYGWTYDTFTTTTTANDGEQITLRMRTPVARKALALCGAIELPVTVVAEPGLPGIGRWIFRRPGVWLGLLLVTALYIVSSRFVWDVRVTGNELLTERQVEETLRTCGFGVGSYLGSFKADRLENKVLMTNDALSWISVNMKGTVAYVQIREAIHKPKAESDTPANLVADTGGQIVRVELERGNVVVSAGQWVGAGDLLVSGLYDSEQVGIRYTHAEGRVYARVVEEILVEIPLTYEKKIHTTDADTIYCEKSLNFFENPIKFSKKDFNSEMSCDIIKRVSVPFSEWGVDFPISWVTEWHIPYTVTEEKRTYAEAEALAYHTLAQRIGSLPGEVEVLSKTVTATLAEDRYMLTCTLTCIRDIAKEQTFKVLP